MRLQSLLASMLPFSIVTATAMAFQQNPKAPGKKAALTKQGKSDHSRSLIPGLGGAPPKPKKLGPPAPIPLPGQTAPVNGPGTLPGFQNLQTRKLNSALYGIHVQWSESGSLKGWDIDDGARARRIDQLIKGAGAGVIRVDLNWIELEPLQGKPDFTRFDQFVRHISTLNIPLVLRILSAPTWALPKEISSTARLGFPSKQYYGELQRFAQTCATRYKGKFRTWQCWDQPDRGLDPASYTDMLSAFSAGVRSGDPAAKISLGSLAIASRDFLAGLYSAGAKPHFDVIPLNLVSDSGALKTNWLDSVRDVIARNGDGTKEIWVTDWAVDGSQSGEPLSPQHQARLVRETLLALQERPYITQAIYRTLLDSKTQGAIDIGLCSDKLMPRPAFYAFRESSGGMLPGAGLIYARAPIMGASSPLADSDIKNAATINIDASKSQSAMPLVGEMVTQSQQLSGEATRTAFSARLKQAGIKTVRFDPFPGPEMIVPDPANRIGSSQYAFKIDWGYADNMLQAIAIGGAGAHIVMGTIPTKLLGDETDAHLPRDLEEWSALAREIARHFKTNKKASVKGWEIGLSEGNSPQKWITMFRAFQKGVLADGGSIKVGGPDSHDPLWVAGLLAALKSDSTMKLDFLTVRGQAPGSREWNAALANWKRINANLPEIIVTGTLATTDKRDAEGLGNAALRLNTAYKAVESGEFRLALEDLFDTKDLRHPTSHFNGRPGMITWDDLPKPEFHAAVSLSKLSGTRIAASSDETTIQALASSSDSSLKILAWRRATVGIIADAILPVNIQVKSIPWTGNTLCKIWIIPQSDGKSLPPYPQPLITTVSGPNIEVPIPMGSLEIALVEITPSPDATHLETPRFTVFSGSDFVATASIANRTSTPQKWRLSVPGSERDSKIIPSSVTLAPGEKRTVEYRIGIPFEPGEQIKQVQLLQDGISRSALFVRVAPPIIAKIEPSRVDVERPDSLPDSIGATARATVAMTNRTQRPVKMGVIVGRTAETTIVQPGTVAKLPITLSAPSSKPGNYLLQVKTLIGEKPLATLQAEISVPALCRYATQTMRINGDLSEWTNAYALPGGRTDGTAEFGAQAFAMWDENNLYIAATVIAPPGETNFSPDQMWRSDSIQIGLDTRRDAPTGQDSYRDTDYLFTIGKSRGVTSVYRSHGGESLPGVTKNIRVAIKTLGNRTFYEAAIPWEELTVRPMQNGIIGFSLVFNSSDNRGRRYLEWGGGIARNAHPHEFFGLRLVKQPSVQP